MTPDLLTLAREIVTLPAWRWVPGMLVRDNCGPLWSDRGRVLAVRDDGIVTSEMQAGQCRCDATVWTHTHFDRTAGAGPRIVPDLADAATLGAIEHGILAPLGWCVVARIAPDGPRVVDYRCVGPGRDGRPHGTRWSDLPTALVAALRAAPVRREAHRG